VGEVFALHPEIEWLTTLRPLSWDTRGIAINCGQEWGYTREGFFRGEHLPECGWHSRCWIQQESTFWRRSLWERAGGKLDTDFKLAGDFELWSRFYKTAELYGISVPLGGYRLHEGQKLASQFEAYLKEASRALMLHGGRPPSRFNEFAMSKLARFMASLQKRYDNRLARGKATRHVVNHHGRGKSWWAGRI
jgi:hypothetical protein